MQPIITNRRLFSLRSSLWLVICLISGVGMGIGRPGAVHAAGSDPDPLVVIAVDQTSPACITRTTRSISTTILSSETSSCLPGTVMAAVTIPRSQAMLDGQPFVVVPPRNATPLTWQQFRSHVDLLVYQQRQTLRQAAQRKAARWDISLQPNGSCGYNVDRFYATIVDGDNIWGDLYYYENPDCADVNLQHTTIELESSYNNPLWWWAL